MPGQPSLGTRARFGYKCWTNFGATVSRRNLRVVLNIAPPINTTCNLSLPGVVDHAGVHLGLLAAAHELLHPDPFRTQEASFKDLFRQRLSFLWTPKYNISYNASLIASDKVTFFIFCLIVSRTIGSGDPL